MKVFVYFFLILPWLPLYFSGPYFYPTDIVTRTLDIHRLYTSLKEFSFETSVRRIKYKKQEKKERICQRILNSQYFKMKHEIYVRLNSNGVSSEVKRYYSKMFDNFFRLDTIEDMIVTRRRYPPPFCLFSRQVIVCNKYSQHTSYQPDISKNVFQEGAYQKEKMFACLARQTRTNRLKQYFIVTLEHRRNESLVFLPIRLIFSHNSQLQLVIEALGEQPAIGQIYYTRTVRTQTEIIERREKLGLYYAEERKLFFNRNGFSLPYNYSSDPLCGKLSDSEKLRVCASVMNANNNIQFWPTIFSLKHRCQQGDISIRDIFQNKARPFEFREWLLGCNGRITKSNELITYHVSIINEYDPNLLGYVRKLDGKFTPQVIFMHVSPMYLKS